MCNYPVVKDAKIVTEDLEAVETVLAAAVVAVPVSTNEAVARLDTPVACSRLKEIDAAYTTSLKFFL